MYFINSPKIKLKGDNMAELIIYKIVRRTSPYNKYIKWFREYYNKDGLMFSSIGYRTEREARDFAKTKSMPIGNTITEYTYSEA